MNLEITCRIELGESLVELLESSLLAKALAYALTHAQMPAPAAAEPVAARVPADSAWQPADAAEKPAAPRAVKTPTAPKNRVVQSRLFSAERDALLKLRWRMGVERDEVVAELNEMDGPKVTGQQVTDRAYRLDCHRSPEFIAALRTSTAAAARAGKAKRRAAEIETETAQHSPPPPSPIAAPAPPVAGRPPLGVVLPSPVNGKIAISRATLSRWCAERNLAFDGDVEPLNHERRKAGRAEFVVVEDRLLERAA